MADAVLVLLSVGARPLVGVLVGVPVRVEVEVEVWEGDEVWLGDTCSTRG